MTARVCGRRAVVSLVLLLGVACSSGSNGGVDAPVQTGSIALVLMPSSVTVNAGGSGSVGLSITRAGFDGPVTLVATGVPLGVTLTFGSNPAVAGTFSTSVTVNASSTAAIATSSVTITGTSGGIASQPTTLTLRTQ